MYTVVLLAALGTGAAEPGWGCACGGSAYIHCGGGGGCHGCWGCSGGGYASSYGYYGGCYGCWGYAANYACYGTCGGSWGCMGYYTCNGCYGCAGFSNYAPTVVSPPVYTPVPVPAVKPAKTPEVAPPPKPKPEPEKKPDQARLSIDLPAEAKLYIDDQLMQTPSAHRTFRTPTLEEGRTYYYIIRAELSQDGKQYSESQRVLVRAGETARASFATLVSAKNEKPRTVASASR